MELLSSTEVQNVKFENNRLVLDENITFDEWKSIGKSLKQREGLIQFCIGDWACFGERKGFLGTYTDSKVYDELGEITGLDRNTIKKYKYVADNVPSLLRSNDLSFSHHEEIAKLPADQQEIFLNKASHDKLSVRELRLQVMSDCGKNNRDYFHPGPIPIRFGNELQSNLQKIAFELDTTISALVIDFVSKGVKMFFELSSDKSA